MGPPALGSRTTSLGERQGITHPHMFFACPGRREAFLMKGSCQHSVFCLQLLQKMGMESKCIGAKRDHKNHLVHAPEAQR